MLQPVHGRVGIYTKSVEFSVQRVVLPENRGLQDRVCPWRVQRGPRTFSSLSPLACMIRKYCCMSVVRIRSADVRNAVPTVEYFSNIPECRLWVVSNTQRSKAQPVVLALPRGKGSCKNDKLPRWAFAPTPTPNPPGKTGLFAQGWVVVGLVPGICRAGAVGEISLEGGWDHIPGGQYPKGWGRL